MSDVKQTEASPISGPLSATLTAWAELSPSARQRLGACVGWVIVCTLLFIQPLARLMVHAAQSEVHSHILLVPFIAAYLLYAGRTCLTTRYSSSVVWAASMCGLGAAALLVAVVWRSALSVNDHLALLTLAYLNFTTAGGFLFLGSRWMASAAFPILFLVFMIPLPDAAVYGLETGSVLASAEVSALFLEMTGTPFLRDGTIFTLPGITIRVAQECSGIRSSWVLLMTSILVSHLFLGSPWRRIALVAFVVPLAIVRNAFRIVTIALLCVHVGPQMIDSFIHHRGGPIFFVLSLGPLFLWLEWLRRQERRGRGAD